MKTKQLAEFYGVNERTVQRWSDKKSHRKVVQAESNCDDQVFGLIGEISRLAYLFDCKNVKGVTPRNWCWIDRSYWELSVVICSNATNSVTAKWTASLIAPDAVSQLCKIKRKLEALIYGVEK